MLVEDKALFYRFATPSLPVPQTVAFLSSDAVWFAQGMKPAPKPGCSGV